MGRIKRTEYAILGVLSIRAMSGYDIKKYIESSIGYFWHENFGSIYPTLNRMVQDELVEKEVRIKENGPDSKIYTLTEKGKRKLQSWLLEEPEITPMREELLFKLFFGDMVTVDTNITRINNYKEKKKSFIQSLNEIEASIEQDIKEKPELKTEFTYQLMTVNRGKYNFEADVKWCDACLRILNEIEEREHSRLKKENNKLVLFNCTIIDGNKTRPISNGVIVIDGDRIEDIGEETDISVPDGYKKVNLEGSTVLPGLINAHVHDGYNEVNLKNWLKSGITTVRDLGPRKYLDPESIVEKREALNKDIMNARLISSTPIITRENGYGRFFINSPQDAVSKVNDFIDGGLDIIKISLEDSLGLRTFEILSPEEVKAIVDTAHERNAKVSVHLTSIHNLKKALEAGVDEIAHMVIDVLDDSLISNMINNDIYFIPTLELWKGVSEVHSIKYGEKAVENLSKFYKAGGKIAFGTDFDGYICEFDKFFPKTEVLLMKKAGLTNLDIITSATKNAAHVCGISDVLGVLEKGKIADMLIVRENPLENIEALFEPDMVIHNGEIVLKKF